MPPVPTDAFAREFRTLPTGERTAFVAALWAERGWETTVEGGAVVAEHDGDRQRIRVVDPGRFGTPDFDGIDVLVAARDRTAVRTAAEAAGVEYVSPADLRNLLLYGIERERARDLYESRVGEPLERAPPPSADESGDASGSGVGTVTEVLPSLPSDRRVVGVLLLVALLAVAVTGSPLPGGGSAEQVQVTVSDAADGDERPGAIGGATPSATESPYLLPGVTRAGVVSPSALAEAHVERVRNRSRVRSVSVTGPPNASVMRGTVAQNLTTWIVNESTYRHQAVSRFGDENESRGRLDVYADGERVYSRLAFGNDTRYAQYSIEERPATEYDDLTRYLYRYFAGADDTVVRCRIEYDTVCPTYEIVIDGDPPAALGEDVAEYEALAIVSQNGAVTTIRARFTVPDEDGDGEREQVRFALDYRFERVTVTAPPWLDDAKNATGTATPTETATPTPNPTNSST